MELIDVKTDTGHAQVTRGAAGSGDDWSIELLVDPCIPTPGSSPGEDLAARAAQAIAEAGGGPVQMWISHPTVEHERLTRSIGLAPGRSLYQMRVPLPYDLDQPDPAFATRSFRLGEDDDAWLGANNRAFDWHPEQGGWDLGTLKQRVEEPWFDPEGFLVHDDEDGVLDGFCWTKIHADHEPPLGEIYVIAVDPAARHPQRGLGRKLVAAGLDHLYGKGLRTGMLYCDATNTRAVKLYVDMGFVVHHIDQVFVGDIAAARPPVTRPPVTRPPVTRRPTTT